jgi:hypothetical protein
MVLRRALAATDVGGDVLAGVTGEHRFHDLSLSQRELGDLFRDVA